MLARLRDNELYIGKNKSELMKEETNFLGLFVGRSGIKIGDQRERLINEWPTQRSLPIFAAF